MNTENAATAAAARTESATTTKAATNTATTNTATTNTVATNSAVTKNSAGRTMMNGIRRAVLGVGIAVLMVAATPAAAAVAATPAPSGDSSSSSDSAGADDSAADAAAAQQQARREQQARQEQQARAAAAAAERARRAQQRAAEAAQRARQSWDGHDQPNKMIIVRTTSVDSVTAGAVTQRVTRPVGALTLARLDTAVPADWIVTTDGVSQLSAALVLTTGVTLDIGGGGISKLALTGGATAAEAASIYTGGGTLTLHDITVASIDPASGQPLPAGPGRPFVQASSGGRLDATTVTFSDLGTAANAPQDRAGVGFSNGSTGSLVRTTVERNSTGVRLSNSAGVRLEGLTVSDSAGSGLVLQGDRGTTLIGVRAERNAENGVQVSGPSSDRPITGISTTGNGQFGLAVVSQAGAQIKGVTTQADGIGGLQLAGDRDPVVSDFAAVDQPVGILTHVSSSNVTLGQLRISGGGRGVVVEKTTEGLSLTGSTIERTQTGISIGAHNIELRDVLVGDSQSGVRVERGAGEVTATALTIKGGQDGVVVVPGTTAVVLRDLVIDGVSNSGVRTAGPDTQILGGKITGTATGIDAGAATTINGTEITMVDVGIRARSTDLVAADDVSVSAVSSGVNVQDGSPFVLTDSRIDALEAVNGQAQYQGLNQLSLPPLNILGAIGIPLVVLALLLDQVQRFRQRGGGGSRRLPPSLHA